MICFQKYPEVIVVTSNYRLGPLGFLASHSLQAQTSDGSVGNFGIQDQRATMRWIRDNIASFGGNPSSVTIQGESAGAGSVSNHIMMPKSAGLFHRGITESGPFAPWSSQTLETSMVKYNQVAISSGCYTPKGSALRAAAVDALGLTDAEAKFVSSDAKVLACLRTKDGKELADIHVVSGLLSWSPVVDGVELTDTVLHLAKQGKIANPVPVLGGTNRDEGTMFVPDDIPKDLNASAFIPTVAKFLKNESVAMSVAALYPLTGCKSPWWCVATMLGDAGITCPTRATATALTAKGMPYYRYFFQHELEVVKDFVPNKGVFHGSELVFVFDIGLALWEKAEKQLSSAFVQYWYNFIATGNPNGVGLPTWPVHDSEDALNVLDTDTDGGSGIHTQTNLKKPECDFWDSHPVSMSVIYGDPLTPSSSTSVDDDHTTEQGAANPLSIIDGAVHATAA